jgi:transposase
MERLGQRPKLCNPLEAKRRMGLTNKTDKLDARGLAILLRNGTLPEVWIRGELRDQRELLRLRIFLVRLRTGVKNRIHGTLARHNVQVPGADLSASQLVCSSARGCQNCRCTEAVEQELATLDFLETQIESAEQRLAAIMKVSAEADLLKTLPCVGKILSMVLMLEIGRADRFPTAAPSYAGLVPRVHSSGGHTRMGQVCGNVNRNLKWAFVETGNLIVISQRRLAGTHVVRLYQRIKRAKNHQKAVVAIARHLAEAAWWVLTEQEVYREPQGPRQALSRNLARLVQAVSGMTRCRPAFALVWRGIGSAAPDTWLHSIPSLCQRTAGRA